MNQAEFGFVWQKPGIVCKPGLREGKVEKFLNVKVTDRFVRMNSAKHKALWVRENTVFYCCFNFVSIWYARHICDTPISLLCIFTSTHIGVWVFCFTYVTCESLYMNTSCNSNGSNAAGFSSSYHVFCHQLPNLWISLWEESSVWHDHWLLPERPPQKGEIIQVIWLKSVNLQMYYAVYVDIISVE